MNEELKSLLTEYKEKFGIELDESKVYASGKWAFLCSPAARAYGKGELIGLKVAKLDGYYKMSTSICQLVGKNATKRVISLNREAAEKIIRGESIPLGDMANGFYVMKYLQYPIAIGQVKNGVLEPQIGKDIKIRK